MSSNRTAYLVRKKRERMHARRAKLIEMLGGKCVQCGSSENLGFDHIRRQDKVFTIGGNLQRPWDELVAEAMKTQLLCEDPCHKAKTAAEQPEPPHGLYRYTDLGCRCEICRAANAAKSKA